MVQSHSWAANWFAASQEILRISRNPKVHYRTHKRPPPVSILGQPNPVHIPTSHLLKIRRNIIHPYTPRSPQWSPSLPFPPPRPYTHPSPHPYAPHAQPISFFYILSPAQYWVSSTDHVLDLTHLKMCVHIRKDALTSERTRESRQSWRYARFHAKCSIFLWDFSQI